MSSPTAYPDVCATSQPSLPDLECVICAYGSSRLRFGVISCRACALFFRRAILDQKMYKCKLKGNCDMHREKGRNLCSACRLSRCFECGMQEEYVEINSRRRNVRIFIKQEISSPRPIFTDIDVRMPIILHASQAYERFIKAQTFIVAGQAVVSGIQQSRVPTKREVLDMYRKSMPLMFTMLDDLIKPLANLDYDAKSVDEMEENLRESATENGISVEELVRVYRPFVEKCTNLCKKFKSLQTRQIDFVILMMIIVWNEGDQLGVTDGNMENHKQAALVEWHSNLVSMFGVEKGCTQLSQLLCLLIELNTIANSIKETMSLSKIFCPAMLEPAPPNPLFKTEWEK
ncbi:zinc finger, c4 type (two domains) domain-containing protein [Ditylenchus destructor]|uniref:Zinc finger, c4 type (Two domains) domain-containing protein n=1 Tax=Ditylenchus destructor TaxID=166010 RepID=A0AAD4NJG0_9BILA|nr:zinc finger, c4 type (two domains) domain-containing protein [Ditylenchus destructor]